MIVNTKLKSWIFDYFGSQSISVYGSLTFEKTYIYTIRAKSVGNKPNNVYIFLTCNVRAFQNRLDHIRTISLDHSTSSQLGLKIYHFRVLFPMICLPKMKDTVSHNLPHKIYPQMKHWVFNINSHGLPQRLLIFSSPTANQTQGNSPTVG